MKKKIVSILLLGMYFLGGFGVACATVILPDGTTLGSPHQSTILPDGTDLGCPINTSCPTAPCPPNTSCPTTDSTTTTTTSTSAPSGGSNDMTSTDFRLNPNDLSPSEKKYTSGTRTNFKTLLANIGKYLLIATTTIAVLSIVVGGLMISTTGPTDRAAKGKTIIILNITAIIVALFSYSIIRLVSWLIA